MHHLMRIEKAIVLIWVVGMVAAWVWGYRDGGTSGNPATTQSSARVATVAATAPASLVRGTPVAKSFPGNCGSLPVASPSVASVAAASPVHTPGSNAASGLTVPMAYGSAAHTGENPGPGPDAGSSLPLRWKYETTAGPSDPVIANGIVYVAIGQSLHAIEAASGQLLWKFRGDSLSYSSPAVVDGLIYVSDGYGIDAIDAATGAKRWEFNPAIDGMSGTGTPVVQGGAVYVVASGYLYVLDARNGAKCLHIDLGERSRSFTLPSVADGKVFVGSFQGFTDGRLNVFDASTGANLWEFAVGGQVIVPPVVSDGIVFVRDNGSFLFALDVQNGTERWRFPVANSTPAPPPVVAGGVVFIQGSDGYLHALDASAGTERWTSTVPMLAVPATIVGQTIYFTSTGGTLFAVSAASGMTFWNSSLSSSFRAPVVLDGVIYIVGNGGLYAFGGTEANP